MDVGAPSNFERMSAHFSWEDMRRVIRGEAVTDNETREVIAQVRLDRGYFLDPHSAVGLKAADRLPRRGDGPLAVLSTAHPAKFAELVEPLAGPVPFPAVLAKAMERKAVFRVIPADVSALLEVL